MLTNQDKRSVKPSAQPTQVRTLHLPLPAKTAPGLRLSRPAGRLLVVPPCCIMCRRGAPCRSGYGHIADGSGAEGAVHGTAGFGRRRARSSGQVAPRTAKGPSYVSGRPGRPGRDGRSRACAAVEAIPRIARRLGSKRPPACGNPVCPGDPGRARPWRDGRWRPTRQHPPGALQSRKDQLAGLSKRIS